MNRKNWLDIKRVIEADYGQDAAITITLSNGVKIETDTGSINDFFNPDFIIAYGDDSANFIPYSNIVSIHA